MNADDLFVTTAPIDGRPVRVVLRLAPYRDLGPVLQDPRRRTAEQQRRGMRLSLWAEIATLDGKTRRLADADRLIADPAALAAVLEKRNELVAHGRELGRLFALCPRCRTGEVELSIPRLVLGLRGGLPELFTPDRLWLLPPTLAGEHPPGTRPEGLPRAARLRFELPTAVLGLSLTEVKGGVLGTIDPAREAEAWEKWAPEGPPQPEERSWWWRGDPAFRAALRLSVAVASFDAGPEPSPEAVVALAAIDVYYLDAIYFLTHHASVPPESSLPVVCPSCSERFLPVA